MDRKMVWTRLVVVAAVCMGLVGISAALQDKPDAKAEETKPVKLDVPYVPTAQEAVDAMLKLGKVTADDFVIDLGCGDGRIVVTAAKTFKAKGYGVDLDPQRIKESKANAEKAGVTDRVKFEVGDIFKADIRQASVVTLFLLDSVNLQLRPKLFAQLKPGTRVVSNTFHMADWKPDQDLEHEKAYSGKIHLWIMPAPVGGAWSWKTKFAEAEVPCALTLDQEFQVIRGTMKVGEAAEAPIAAASLKGKEIRFTATTRMGDKDVKISCEGIADGDTIKGTQKWEGGPAAGTPWTATRQAVDVAGKWQIDVPGNDGLKGTLNVQRKDDGLHAAYLREGKEEVAVPAFYAWGTSVRFEIPGDAAGTVFRGSLKADAGGGTLSGGQTDAGTAKWTAKRAAK